MVTRLTFCGAAKNVTGSRYLLEMPDHKFMVDCGMFQERQFLSRNWEPFRVPPKELEAVLITHAHLDHCGLLPKLVSQGFHGRIICTSATADLARIILLDSARLQEEDAAYKKKRHLREGRQGPYPEIPLYTTEDVEATLPLFEGVAYDTPVPVTRGVNASFHDAGHVLGSSMIEVAFDIENYDRDIIFSGDIGRWDRPMLKDPHLFRNPDYVVMESTYGDRKHEQADVIASELADIINETIRAGGHIIVPSFALQRAQEILYYMNELLIDGRIPDIDVYLDSPMAIRITEVYKHYEHLFDREMQTLLKKNLSPFDFPGLKFVQTTDESKALNFLKKPSMIIAGSGMITGGRIKHHVSNNISRPESTILFIGYQAEGTLGRIILDGANTVRIFNRPHIVRARIAQINGLSAHADRDDLTRWVGAFKEKPEKLFITHGEEKTAIAFSHYLSQKGFKTVVPNYGDTAVLT